MTTPNNEAHQPQESQNIKYPASTAEVAQMLGIHSASQGLPVGSFTIGLPHNLPVINEPAQDAKEHAPSHLEAAGAEVLAEENISENIRQEGSAFLRLIRGIAPYVAVFSVGLFLYYFFFTGVDFTRLFRPSITKVQTAKDTALAQLEKEQLPQYQKWIASYYYDVSDPKILDPQTDNSGNGLTNFQKFLFNLNPKAYDTLGIGMPDGQTLAMGVNPQTGTKLSDDEKNQVSKYIDMEVVNNRLALYRLQHGPRVAGAEFGINNQDSSLFFQNAQAVNQNVYSGQNQKPAVQTGVNLIAGNSEADININIPGRLEIPDLKINVPIMWSNDPKDFDKDLQSGVIHYPGTAMPGQIGTTYISGHSSNFAWAKGSFKQVFAVLGKLADNTSFKITVVQKNGKDAIFHYVVTGRKEYSPTDQAQFANSGKSVVALSTCWPVGSTAKRLVVYGELTQTEK